MLKSQSVLAMIWLALLAGTARAQDTTIASSFLRRSSGSVAFIQSRPQGAFRRNVGLGYGASGAYVYRLDASGIFSIRAEVGAVSYGDESRQTPLSSTIGGRVNVRVETSNYVIPMSIGPQLTWPSGSLRPYVNVGVGGQGFVTETHVEDESGSSFASTTNHSAFASSWVLGGGVYMPMLDGKTKVSLDLGVQYLRGGRADYLTSGSIVDLPDSQIRITPSRSDTHMFVVKVGARIGL